MSARYKIVSRGNLNSNVAIPVTHSRSINSNFEADVLETQAKLGKMLMIFVISISKLTKTARSDDEVRGHILTVYLLVLVSNISAMNQYLFPQ